MPSSIRHRDLIHFVGIHTRTSYDLESSVLSGKIFPCVMKYFHASLADKIPFRKSPGTTLCVYTEYDHDYRGSYTYLIGEEVTSRPDSLDPELRYLVIPEQTYAIHTVGPGAMPDVLINGWKEIWHSSEENLGGKRSYKTDFEVYDERAADHQNIVLDICIGIQRPL